MVKLTPLPWQIEDQRMLRASGYTGLVATEAGGGKSLTATLATKDSGADVTLIIAPKSTFDTAWIPTLRDNIDVEARVMGAGKKAEKQAYLDFLLGYPGVYLVTPQWVSRTDTSEWSGDLLIHDEAHQGNTMGTKLQRTLGGYSPADDPIAPRFGGRMALSGTPLRQAFANAWGLMRLLWPEYSSRGQIADANPFMWQVDRMTYEDIVTGVDWFPCTWEEYRNRGETWGKVIEGQPHLGEVKKAKKYLGEKDPGKLLSEMPCAIIHKRRETCCPWHVPVQRDDGTWTTGGFLPTEEPQVIERRVELTAKQKRSIREMESIMMTYIDHNPLVADIPLTQKQRIRQLTLGEAEAVELEDDKTTIRFPLDAPSPFTDETLHILSNLPDDENVVVFLESQQYAEVLVHRLNKDGYVAQEYSGKRKADLSKFGTDYRILVGVLAAIGTGTAGLNHVSHTEIVFEQPVSLTLKEQGAARLDRMDNKHRVQRYILLDSEGVQEGRIDDLAAKKLAVNRSLRRAS